MNLRPIIYVEDDDNDVFLMKRAFKTCSVPNPLVICNDGQEAIDTLGRLNVSSTQLVQENLPALIVLDLNLPAKTGHDVLAWIRGSAVLRNIVVIILTSSSHDVDVHKAYSLGANAYVVKPPVFDALLETAKAIRDFWLKQNFAPPLRPSNGLVRGEEGIS